jgi:pantoate--beta-alanine ligase
VLLEEYQADLLFAPEVSDMYPQATQYHTVVEVPELSDILCGAVRPDILWAWLPCGQLHSTSCNRMSLCSVKRLSAAGHHQAHAIDLCMPLQVIGVPTVREADGLP